MSWCKATVMGTCCWEQVYVSEKKVLGTLTRLWRKVTGHFFNRFYNSLRRIRRTSGKNCGCDPAMHEECGCRPSVPTVRRIPPEITQGIRVAVDKLERVEDTGRRIETGAAASQSSPDKMVDVAFIAHKKASGSICLLSGVCEDMTSDEEWSNTGSSSEESAEPRRSPP
uniref:Uncharacterized protein n=1 Tax=Timema bartmani TaxID=61472 RepID=A0A7R9FD09_9NEOP|nr:unnamed protein product [Timema bartmani]